MDNLAEKAAGKLLPTPTTARRELPDQAAVDAAEIPLPLEEARLVLVVVSQLVGRGRSKSRAHVHAMLRMLTSACSLPLERDGLVEEAAHPALGEHPWPEGVTALRRLGIDHRKLAEYWASVRKNIDGSLPLAWTLEFVPADAWPLVATIIRWGPERARLQMEEAVAVLAQTPVRRPTRRRPSGNISLGTINHRLSCVWKLFDALVTFRARLSAVDEPVLERDLLEAWAYRPERPDPREFGAKDAGLDGSGPPLASCSRRLKELAADYEAAPRHSRYRRLQHLVLMAILCLFGPRGGALCATRVDDYLPEFSFRDGGRGPCLRIFPGKTKDEDEPYYLPLPSELAAWLEAWIELNGFTIGQEEAPLFPSRKGRLKPLGKVGFYSAVAGHPNRDGTGSYALMARGDDLYVGWHPHAFRRTAYKAAVQAGTRVKMNRPHEFEHVQPKDFASAVVGHALVRDVGDVYRDLNEHHLARAAVEEAWSVLWDDGVLRRGPDPAAIKRHREEVELFTAGIAHYEGELRRLGRDLDALAKGAKKLTGDELTAALITSNRLTAKLETTGRELRKLETDLERARDAHEEARVREVPLDHELTDEEYQRELAVALGQTDAIRGPRRGPLADEITPADFAEVMGTTEQAVNRWIRVGPPRGRPLPWRGEEAWRVYGARKKRLCVDAINEAGLTDKQRERLLEVRARRAQVDRLAEAA